MRFVSIPCALIKYRLRNIVDMTSSLPTNSLSHVLFVLSFCLFELLMMPPSPIVIPAPVCPLHSQCMLWDASTSNLSSETSLILTHQWLGQRNKTNSFAYVCTSDRTFYMRSIPCLIHGRTWLLNDSNECETFESKILPTLKHWGSFWQLWNVWVKNPAKSEIFGNPANSSPKILPTLKSPRTIAQPNTIHPL